MNHPILTRFPKVVTFFSPLSPGEESRRPLDLHLQVLSRFSLGERAGGEGAEAAGKRLAGTAECVTWKRTERDAWIAKPACSRPPHPNPLPRDLAAELSFAAKPRGRGNCLWLAICVCGLALLAAVCPTPAAAEGARWTRHRLPMPGNPSAGFGCEVRMLDPENYGYLPVQLTATATTGQFPADRQLTVEVVPIDGANWPQPRTRYQFLLELPEGERTVTVEQHLPKYFVGANFRIQLSEGGRAIQGYVLEHHSGRGDRWLNVALLERTTRYTVILADPSVSSAEPWARVPDVRTLGSMAYPSPSFLMASEVDRLSDADALLNLRTDLTSVRQVMHASETHTSWLGYESTDVVIVSFGVLERMRDEHPERFKALSDWVACGGAVWTAGVESREALAELFGTTPLAAGDPTTAHEVRATLSRFALDRVLPPNDWFLQQIRQHDLTTLESAYMNRTPEERWNTWSTNGHPVAQTLTERELEQAIIPQPLMAGIVIGFQDPDPFPGSFQLWHVAKHFTAARQVWSLKHGTMFLQGTERFWDWTLQNVARPPVYAFLGVLTGFVILVGPVSYYWTRRNHRTYLMFLIAPVLATVATLMLFGYGVLADGLGTQVRVRQITWAEGSSPRAARMTRATYFAGFRPSGGMEFSPDAAVYPIIDLEEAQTNGTIDPPNLDRVVTLSDDRQRLGGEFLPARRQKQFVATEPIDDAGGIALVQSAPANLGQPPKLQNDFDVEVYELIARDSAGEYYTATGPIAAGGVGQVRRVPATQAAGILRRLYQIETPEPPLGYQSSGARSLFGRQPYYHWGGTSLQNHAASWLAPAAELGMFEAKLGGMLFDRGELPPGWFVGRAALTADAIVVEGAVPVSSVHFIMGGLR
ncbi:hypothetical protein [Candidatus Laterigemmans baculatus]|uniref:hypothetical protein n=1 Tax=Candidatus Laterigemmans baculatus TaxID=2770505 RepID=UPI00193BC875|nr:hypothetical protein [Candidatus Laterigemmans baculatus]